MIKWFKWYNDLVDKQEYVYRMLENPIWVAQKCYNLGATVMGNDQNDQEGTCLDR